MPEQARRRDRSLAVRYGGAVLLTLAAGLIRWTLNPVLGLLYPFATFFIGNLISQWLGGLGPALLAVFLGAISANYLFNAPVSNLSAPNSLVGFSLYFIASLTAISLMEAQKRARLLAEQRLEQWREERVLREAIEARAGVHRRQSELILASIGDAVIATDSEGRIEFLNAVAESLTGWAAEAAVGRPLEEVFRIVNEDTRAPCEKPARRILRGGRIQGLANHTILIDRNGREVPIDDSGAPIRDESGRIGGVVLVFRDIGDRRRAERALQQAEANYRALFHTASVGIVTCDAQTLRYQQVNSRMCLITGYSEAEMLELTPQDITIPDDFEREAASRLRLMQGETAEHYTEKRYRRKDGGVVWVQVWASVIADPDGQPRLLAAVIEDITERRDAAEAIRTSEERYRSLVAATSSLVWTTDALGAFTTPQPLWQDFTGQTWEQYREWGWADALHPDDRDRIQTAWAEAVATRSAYEAQGRIWHAESERYHYYVARAAPLLNAAGSVREWIGTITDIDQSQRAVHASAQFGQVLDLAGDGIFVLSMDGTIELWNQGAERIYGWSSREAVGRRSSDLLQTQYPEPLEQIRETLLAAGHWKGELVHIGRDGARIVVLSRSALRRDIDGAPAGFLEITTDITDRKRAEEELRVSEQRLKLALAAGGMGVWTRNIAEGTLAFSRRGAEIVGLSPGETPSQKFLERLHPDDRDRVMLRLARALRGESDYAAEYRVVWLNGSIHWVSSAAVPVRDEAENPTQLVGVIQDITERKRAEIEFREVSRRLQLHIENSPLAYIEFDASQRISKWSGQAERIFGWNADEVIGKRAEELSWVHEEDLDRVRRLWAEISVGARRNSVSANRNYRKDGSVIDCEWYNSVLTDDAGQILSVQSMVQDVTERNTLEKKLQENQKLESIGLLAGGIAHDFNNLLVGVMGNASLVQEHLPPAHEAWEMLADVVKAAERAADLTRQLLAYAGRGRFVVEPVSLSEIVEDVSGLLRPTISSRKVFLQLALEHNIPLVEADPSQIQQIVMNLVLNAAEATGDAGGAVTVRTASRQVDETYLRDHLPGADIAVGRYVSLEVSDAGCGMDEATVARIFDPFFTTKFMGRGLGLAAVSGIVRGHKGTIRVVSSPGKGSRFLVLLPEAEDAALTRRARRLLRKAPIRDSGTILVVDDQEMVRQTAKLVLERCGYEVLVAESGPGAIEIFRARADSISLVILDLSMPGMGGVEVLPLLREIKSGVAVILSSGYSEAETMRAFGGQKVSGVIQKPYTSASLAEKVREALA